MDDATSRGSGADEEQEEQQQHPAKRRRTTPPQQSLSRSTSPTSASLARHQPDVLQRKLANAAAVAKNREAARAGASSLANGVEDTENTRPEEQVDASKDVPTDNGDVQDAQDVNGTRRGMAARPRRSNVRTSQRDSEILEPDAAVDDSVLSTLTRSKARRSGPFSKKTASSSRPSQAPSQDQPIDLPPTPIQRGIPDPIVTTPPSGIHKKLFPRKNAISRAGPRSRKQKGLSPLKQAGFWDAEAGAGGFLYGAERVDAGPHPARGVLEHDPDEEKKKDRDALKEKLAALSRDLKILEKEERRAAELARKPRGGKPKNAARLLAALSKHLLPEEKKEVLITRSLLESAMNPISWLPFGNMDAPVKPPALPEPDDEPLMSHYPVEMSAEEELPFLQLFTPLALEQTTTVLPARPGEPVFQEHIVNVASNTPKGAFVAQVQFKVNTTMFQVTELAFPRLDPAAVSELRPFLDGLCQPGRMRSLANNVTIATWAMGEWCRVAMERAVFWRDLEEEMGTEQHIGEAVVKMRARDRRRNGKSPRGDAERRQWTVSELLPYMGRTSMEIELPDSSTQGAETFVRMLWGIEFDWTGDARSNVSVLVGMPGKWIQADDRATLGGVSKLWKNLIDGGQRPIVAIKTVVALLAGEDES